MFYKLLLFNAHITEILLSIHFELILMGKKSRSTLHAPMTQLCLPFDDSKETYLLAIERLLEKAVEAGNKLDCDEPLLVMPKPRRRKKSF